MNSYIEDMEWCSENVHLIMDTLGRLRVGRMKMSEATDDAKYHILMEYYTTLKDTIAPYFRIEETYYIGAKEASRKATKDEWDSYYARHHANIVEATTDTRGRFGAVRGVQ